MFPVLHDCMDQLSWQRKSDMASAVWVREVDPEPPTQCQTEEFRGKTAVSLFAPSCQAQHCMASNTETWDTTRKSATKGLLASGALQREPSCFFWDTRKASPWLHMKDILEQSFPAPLRRCDVLTMLIKHPIGVPSPSPQSWLHATCSCNTPGQLDKPRSWAVPGKGILFTHLHSICSLASLHHHSQLLPENATAPFTTRLSQGN